MKNIDEIKHEKRLYIAFDVGGTHVKHGLLNWEGSFLKKGSYPTPCLDLDQFLDQMTHAITEYKKEHAIQGIAISLPGFINIETGYSERAGSIRVLDGKNLKELIEQMTGYQVEIENDGNCAALAEKLNGNAEDCQNFICLTIGTGIGGGIFINGRILHGSGYKGGEFGFMLTPPSTESKPFMHGNASTSALIQRYKELKQLKEVEAEGEAVFLAAEKDPEIGELLDTWYKNISYGIFNLAVTLNPEKILIGGGISQREDLIEEILARLNQIPYWDEFNISLEPCKHRNDAGMLGALYHFKTRLAADVIV
ncbi:ROK family protein [Peribacillus kribbensis]|uniref:ROK family protein n=1 Tax=Peribacillus kribbensis TaxID=356658 RepID=UPI000425A271|nr:ROK family protein [Peribacillus kribbensis]